MKLTDGERKVLDLLAESYNAFVDLEPQYSTDLREYAFGIHALQNIVASRVARRVDPDVWVQSDYHEGRPERMK